MYPQTLSDSLPPNSEASAYHTPYRHNAVLVCVSLKRGYCGDNWNRCDTTKLHMSVSNLSTRDHCKDIRLIVEIGSSVSIAH